MIAKLITRSSLLGSASSVAWFSIAVDVPNNPSLNKEFKTKKNHWPKEVKDAEGLKLYERIKGCKFVFVKDWAKRQNYNADGVINKLIEEKSSEQGWWRAVFESSWTFQKHRCDKTKILVLDRKGNQFNDFK